MTAGQARAGYGATVVALLFTSALIAGCASSTGATGHPPKPAATRGANAAATTVRSTGVRVDVVLDRRVTPADGTPIRGYAEVTNASGKPVTIDNACNGWLYVGLTTRHLTFDPAIAGVGCVSGQLPAGTTRIPITVSTTYQECKQPGGGSTGPPPPRCIGRDHNVMPPLPAGRYDTRPSLWDSRTPRSSPGPSRSGSSAITDRTCCCRGHAIMPLSRGIRSCRRNDPDSAARPRT